MTSIEWTEATWNPIAGCTVLSPGCKRCYAMKMARRLELMGSATYAGLTQQSAAGPVWTGKIAVNESTMFAPLRRCKPTMYFVNSMSDLFHESVPDDVIDRVFAVMEHCRQHTFQVLTKRSDRMRAYLTARKTAAPIMVPLGNGLLEQHPFNNEMQVPPHIWLGVSVEDQKRADERIDDLEATPAAIRFLSIEPMLGPIDLSRWLVCPRALDGLSMDPSTGAYECCTNCDWTGVIGSIDWIIVGGESGHGARPMHPHWARSLRDQCETASVPFFFKQWGEWAPICEMAEEQIDACYHPAPEKSPEASRRLRRKQCVLHADGQRFDGEAMYRRPAFEQGSRAMTMMAIGKKAAGRTLEGVTHDAMPQVQAHG